MRRCRRPAVLFGLVTLLLLQAPSAAFADSPRKVKPQQARIIGTTAAHTDETRAYSAASSLPEGRGVTYRWRASSGAVIAGRSTARTVNVRFDAVGEVTLALQYTDSGGGAAGRRPQKVREVFSITVTHAPNQPPVFLPDRQVHPLSAPRGYFSTANVSFMDPDGHDASIVSVECTNCRQPASIYNNSNKAGTTEEQIEAYTVYLPCLPQNVGVTITVDDGHGNQIVKQRTVVVYSGPAYNC